MPAIWRNRIRTASSAALAMSICGFAMADNGQGPAPVISMMWDASGDAASPFSYNPEQFANPGQAASFDTWHLGGTPQNPGPVRDQTGWRYRGGFSSLNSWSLTWDCVVNPDPFVDATINVTNNSNATQTFVLFMPLNIIPVGPGSVMDGSVSASLSSQSFINPAMLAAPGGESVYQAYIDGGLVKTLWDPGYSLVAAPLASAGDTTNFNNQIGPAANLQLALQLKFTLSAGDSASVTGIFNIVPVPGPASLALFGLFGTIVGGRRRRA